MDRDSFSNPSPPPDFGLDVSEKKIAEIDGCERTTEDEATGTEDEVVNVDQVLETPDLNDESWGGVGDDEYYCKVCKSSMNSLQTWINHLNGKRHKKKLSAANYTTQDQVKIENGPNTNVKQIKIAGAPLFIRTRRSLTEPLIQSAFDKVKEPVIGLSFVTEIQIDDSQEPVYHCALCPADCQVITIINHVIGFKHRMAYMKLTLAEYYHDISHSSEKKCILSERAERCAKRLEKLDGRGQMMVEIQTEADESPELTSVYDKAVPQLPPSTLPQLLEQARNLNGSKYLQLLEELTRDLSMKPAPGTERKIQMIMEVLEKKFYDSMISLLKRDQTKVDKVNQDLIAEDYAAVLENVFHMSVGSVGEITKSVLLQIAEENKSIPRKRTKKM